MVKIPDTTFWRGKRVLLTGHTGFKGGWIALWLERLGAEVVGVALPPAATPNLYALASISAGIDSRILDIRDTAALRDTVHAAKPDIVFHLAAQALVRASYSAPLETFEINVMGTASLLECLRDTNARVAVIITTDKVYQNLEHCFPYREDDRLGGHDPYSASKAASEIVIASYRDSFLASQGVAVASARAGNVIGGGDWSDDRLIPDAVRCWQRDDVLEIRRPDAVRPWQHVLEPLAGYLLLAEELWMHPNLASAYNFGPETHEAATVRMVIDLARAAYGQGKVHFGEGTQGPHEAGHLSLEIAKARSTLAFQPRWSLKEAVDRTMTWYRMSQEGTPARLLCERDFDAYGTQA